MKKISFVSGISGQLGSYLAEYLIGKGEKVYGLYRRSSQSLESNPNLHYLRGVDTQDLEFVEGDITDQGSISRLLKTIKPDCIFNAGAQSHVMTSFEQPITTAEITGLGVLNVLEAIRESSPTSRFVQFSTSELFGKVQAVPQNETTPFRPRSPYGVAKLFGFEMVRNYRESYNMFASNAIIFNSESPRRGLNFVTRKITNAVASIYYGLSHEIEMGNLDSQRDWSYAGDTVDGVYKVINHTQPDDFVLSSDKTHSIKDFLTEAFAVVGINDWAPYIKINPKFIRPAEVDLLVGDSTKARTILGWKPTVDFKTLVKMMVDADIARLQPAIKIS